MKQTVIKLSARVCLAFFLAAIPFSSALAAELTERDWMIALVDALGWSYGLPDEPQDPDYINILTGNREFRFEAEDIYSRETDNVSLMTFRSFGKFSGSGWLHGIRESTEVHLNFSLPLGGEYLVIANLRQPGHRFKINGVDATGDAENIFTEVELGTFKLNPGPQEIVITLPPNGSIDYLSLSAANLAPIAPKNGWDPDKKLSWEAINTTLLQLLSLAEVFPSSQDINKIQAEKHPQPGVRIVETPYLGRPEQGKWLRVGPLLTDIRIPLQELNSGFYDLSLRAMGGPITIIIGNHYETTINTKNYLDDYSLPVFFFNGQESNITLSVPPGGGVDQLTLVKKIFRPEQVETLLGINQRKLPTESDLDTITTLLAAFGVER